MKTKTKKRLAGAAGILIILGLLLAVDAFTGDPVSRAWAEWRALRRAETLYPGQTFSVTKSYGGQFFSYGATVRSTASPDTCFDVSTDFWLFTEDRAEQQVENRWTTCCRMGEEGADLISEALAQEAPQLLLSEAYGEGRTVELDLGWAPDNDGSSGVVASAAYRDLLPLDAPFDVALLQAMPSRVCIQVLWAGTPTRDDLTEVLHTVKTVLESNSLPVTYYDVTLVPMLSLDEYNRRYSDHQAYLNEVVESGAVPADQIA